MPPEAIEPFTCGLGYHYAVVTCRLPVRRLSCLLRVRRPLCLSFVELEIALTNLRDFLDPSRLIRVSSFAFRSSRSFASHSRLIIRIRIIAILSASSFAFGSPRSFASHHAHYHCGLRASSCIRIIAILCASSFAFGSSQSPSLWEHPSPLRRRQLLLRPPHCRGLVPPLTLSAGRTSCEAFGALPFSVRLPEHRCFYGLTSSSTICPSIAAFMASLPLRPSARASLLLWLHLPPRPSARTAVANFSPLLWLLFPHLGPGP